MTTGMRGRPRESGRDAQTLKQMNAPKPSANTLVNETSLIKHDEENPGKLDCLLRDSGRTSFGLLKALLAGSGNFRGR